jgi:hypothetical protein
MTSSELMQELKLIREELQYIKEHMVDVDMVLTPEEEESLDECMREYREGKTVRLEDFKREVD